MVVYGKSGKVDFEKIRENANKYKKSIIITVNIDWGTADPEIMIKTNDFSFNEETGVLFIKEGLLSNQPSSNATFAIKIENSTLSFPHGARVKIENDGKTKIIESYPFFSVTAKE